MKRLLFLLILILATNAWAEEARKTYYPDGQLSSEAVYVDGKLEGLYRDFHKNGNIESIGQYLNGKETGKWQYFTKDGTLVEEGNFVKGKEEGVWKYYSKSQQQRGTLFELVQYKRGLENGVAATFYPNGTVRCKTSYLYGQVHGMKQSFFSSGNIRSQFPFRDGKIHGKGHAWTDEGKLVVELTYSNDKHKKTAFTNNLDFDEAWGLLDIGKVKGKRGGKNHDKWFTFFPCGESGWTDAELFDELD